MQPIFHHRGKYTGDDFTIDEVISSLEAQKNLIIAGLRFLSESDENFDFENAKIRVESITKGTLAWDLLVEVYGGYQDQIEGRVVAGLEEIFDVDIPPEYEGMVTLAALAVTYIVARYAYERVARSSESSAPSIYISGENNKVVQQVAHIIGKDETLIKEALERSVPPAERKRLIPKVADFLRPAKKKKGDQIELSGAPNISPEVLEEFPSDAALSSVDDSRNIDVVAAKLNIRGLDRDKHKQGWHAVILDDDRFPKRLPMDLYPTVNPEELAKHSSVTANVTVECDISQVGQMKPKRIHLLDFQPLDADAT